MAGLTPLVRASPGLATCQKRTDFVPRLPVRVACPYDRDLIRNVLPLASVLRREAAFVCVGDGLSRGIEARE